MRNFSVPLALRFGPQRDNGGAGNLDGYASIYILFRGRPTNPNPRVIT